MASSITQARPYARAAFDYAKEHNVLTDWLETLQITGALCAAQEVIEYIKNPKVSKQQAINLFAEVVGAAFTKQHENFFLLLADSKQLHLLPEIAYLFTAMYEEDGEVVSVDVASAFELTTAQQDKLQTALEKRLGKKIKLHCKVDTALMGGALIQTSEWVIDGSVKGKLQQLKTKLVG